MLRWERLKRLELTCEINFKSYLKDGELWWRATAHKRGASDEPLASEADDLAIAVLSLVDLADERGWLARSP